MSLDAPGDSRRCIKRLTNTKWNSGEHNQEVVGPEVGQTDPSSVPGTDSKALHFYSKEVKEEFKSIERKNQKRK